VDLDDTREVYGTIGFDEVFLAPKLSVYYDVKEADGFYGSLSIGHSIEASEKVSVELGASIGYADSEYNTFYFGTDDAAFNDVNVSLNVPIAITDNFSITPGVSYTALVDGDISDAVEDNDIYYGDTEKVVGVIKLSYTF
jgi:outer membrane scaffolding protein for murein synthesis (MipA/OmpV family)